MAMMRISYKIDLLNFVMLLFFSIVVAKILLSFF